MAPTRESRGRKPLSPRQAEIVGLVASGLADKEIAQRLGISIHTVRTHLERVFREQEVRNRSEAAARALSEESPPPARPEGRLQLQSVWALLLVAGVFVAGVLAGNAVGALPGEDITQPAAKSMSGPAAVQAARRQGPSSPSTAAGGHGAAAQVAAPPSGQARTPGHSVSPPTSSDPALAEAGEINAVRAAAGLPALEWQGCLAAVASQNAKRIADQGYLSPAGGSLADGICDPGATADEILVYWSSPDPHAVTQMLLADPLHRSQLLGAHHAVGSAWAVHGIVAYLVVELA